MKIINSFVSLAIWAFLFLLFFFSKPSHQATTGETDPYPFENPRLYNAFIALQAWKHSITSDPKNFTSNWCGPHVCNYTGVYCTNAQDDSHIRTVAGIDINHANMAGTLPEDLGLLTDISLFHINSNRFHGIIPNSFHNLRLLYELDVSNNRLSGGFPSVVLHLPSLKFLDIRYNEFTGNVPSKVFELKLDALFINSNKFSSSIPRNIGKLPVSVLVFANNNFKGCFPRSIANMSDTLEEIILMNVSLTGCLPPEIGNLKNLRVFDVSSNDLVGTLPESMGDMKKLEQLNVAHNSLSGEIPASICSLPRLKNFTYSYNYFCSEPDKCLKLRRKNDKNCIPDRPSQRPVEECKAFYSHPVDCGAFGCPIRSPPPAPVHSYHYL